MGLITDDIELTNRVMENEFSGDKAIHRVLPSGLSLINFFFSKKFRAEAIEYYKQFEESNVLMTLERYRSINEKET